MHNGSFDFIAMSDDKICVNQTLEAFLTGCEHELHLSSGVDLGAFRGIREFPFASGRVYEHDWFIHNRVDQAGEGFESPWKEIYGKPASFQSHQSRILAFIKRAAWAVFPWGSGAGRIICLASREPQTTTRFLDAVPQPTPFLTYEYIKEFYREQQGRLVKGSAPHLESIPNSLLEPTDRILSQIVAGRRLEESYESLVVSGFNKQDAKRIWEFERHHSRYPSVVAFEYFPDFFAPRFSMQEFDVIDSFQSPWESAVRYSTYKCLTLGFFEALLSMGPSTSLILAVPGATTPVMRREIANAIQNPLTADFTSPMPQVELNLLRMASRNVDWVYTTGRGSDSSPNAVLACRSHSIAAELSEAASASNPRQDLIAFF